MIFYCVNLKDLLNILLNLFFMYYLNLYQKLMIVLYKIYSMKAIILKILFFINIRNNLIKILYFIFVLFNEDSNFVIFYLILNFIFILRLFN